VYASARNIESVTNDKAVAISLDVTSASDIAAAVKACSDVTMLINNAGILRETSVMADNAIENAKAEFETNVWGPLNLSKSFAPILAANGGGAIVNVLSLVAWMSVKEVGTYAMSKSAAWSLTNSLRLELAEQGTLVVAVHPAFVDTDMAAKVVMPKTSTFQVVERTLDAVEACLPEVIADDMTMFVKNNLSNHIEAFYPHIKSPRP
jgi:short-subunit dehydrogenase